MLRCTALSRIWQQAGCRFAGWHIRQIGVIGAQFVVCGLDPNYPHLHSVS